MKLNLTRVQIIGKSYLKKNSELKLRADVNKNLEVLNFKNRLEDDNLPLIDPN